MENMIVSSSSTIDSTFSDKSSKSVNVGYSASLTDIVSFEHTLNEVQAERIRATRIEKPSNTEKAVLKPLDFINNEAENIVQYAKSAVASGNELTPSEIVILTARSHEFMFHCQLTSNIANRTSDGLQQLFRQQG